MHTHYDNLKVARNAPPEIIRMAYKTLCQKYHPDKFTGNKESAERVIKIINSSYAVLSDPEKRKAYDQFLDTRESMDKDNQKNIDEEDKTKPEAQHSNKSEAKPTIQIRKPVKCKECKKEVSTEDNFCPYCGVKNPGLNIKNRIVGLVLVILFLSWYLSSNPTPYKESSGLHGIPPMPQDVINRPVEVPNSEIRVEQEAAQAKPQVQPNKQPNIQPLDSSWTADWGSGIHALITSKKCIDAEFMQQGYNYQISSSIPLERLKNPADSWFVSGERATTVIGCWFKKEDGFLHYKMRRKKDNKIFEQDINISDGSWIVPSNPVSNLSSSSVNPQSTYKQIAQPSREMSFQNEFETSRTSKLTAYISAINEIQKSAIFKQANVDTASILSKTGGNIAGWTGKIRSIVTSHGGSDVRVGILTSNNVEYNSDVPIPFGSPIYNQVSTLTKGQPVVFSGRIIQNSGGYERSITEEGSLETPEFNVEFTSIESTSR